ncbi:Glycine/D-amino acid oxidase [Marininema mesophilum]|uniref:Glycine/D-amino acid oxidase n=1 Tax=Marininema mesophilum TaxID=1048340 RepID=A0A1H3C9Q5_9BACL|nr:FAD-dependent oxidoreductase [Marininema mesophilum]SDX50770.1 Glycine/D-amino acid oxidase [Marininema mesophilum]
MQKNIDEISSLPDFPESYWRESMDLNRFPKLNEDIHTDVVIIGGGITGVTTAYLLAESGCKVVLVDADRLFNGTTGHTTAKVTAQHGFIYHDLVRYLGLEKAKQYYQANMEAIQFIKEQVFDRDITCDFREEKAYLFTMNKANVIKIEQEIEAYRRLGIDGGSIENLPIDILSHGSVVMNGQAQFHPLAYLTELVAVMEKKGVQIYENTKAVDLVEGDSQQVVLENGKRITSDKVVIASHFPFYDSGFYFTRLKAERSYVLALRRPEKFSGGMYLSVDDPVRSIRSVQWEKDSLVLVGGENHQTGQGIDTLNHYEALRQFAGESLGAKEIVYRWSAQDLTSLDRVPYIGPLSSRKERIYVATGYRKWGMTQSIVAAKVLSDQIVGRDNPYAELYSPSRFHVNPGVKQFTLQGIDVAAHLIKGKFEIPTASLTNIGKDEAAVVILGGDRTGAYRDLEGKLYLVDTTCTHMGCEVEWNDGDRTWDCPCHGSRFSFTGNVIEGPAKKPLLKLGNDVGQHEGMLIPEAQQNQRSGNDEVEAPSN